MKHQVPALSNECHFRVVHRTVVGHSSSYKHLPYWRVSSTLKPHAKRTRRWDLFQFRSHLEPSQAFSSVFREHISSALSRNHFTVSPACKVDCISITYLFQKVDCAVGFSSICGLGNTERTFISGEHLGFKAETTCSETSRIRLSQLDVFPSSREHRFPSLYR